MTEGKSDVLIIGAGPAGATAGTILAQRGYDVCVVDRARFPRPKTCGDAVSHKAMDIIESIGAGDALRAGPHTTVPGAAAFLPSGHGIFRSYEDHPGYIVPRDHLDNVLRQRCEEAGAKVIEGVRVRNLMREGGRLTGAEAIDWRWRAKAIIAADGAGSVSWKAIGRPYPRGRQLAVAATAYARNVGTFPREGYSNHYFEKELPCGYSWIFPEVEGLSNIGVYQRSDAFHEGGKDLKTLFREFMERMPLLKDATIEGKVRVWSLPIDVTLKPPSAPGVLLVGDAGNFIDPLAGEGIFQALRTAQIAAEIIDECLTADRGIDEAAVSKYQRICAKEIGLISVARAGIQDAMRWIVDHNIYKQPWVRWLLQWSYGGGKLDITKKSKAG